MLHEREEYIKLGQLLKLSGLVDSGLEAKIHIKDGKVKLNDEIVLERGKKVYPGDIVKFQDNEIEVKGK